MSGRVVHLIPNDHSRPIDREGGVGYGSSWACIRSQSRKWHSATSANEKYEGFGTRFPASLKLAYFLFTSFTLCRFNLLLYNVTLHSVLSTYAILLNCLFLFVFIKGSFSCKRGFSLLNFERGLKKTMGCLILKLYVVIILY